MRENARFWLEGIGITVVGVVGLAGNIMAIFVLRTYSTNVSFNRLLMSLAVVDSLLIVDMVIQKAIIGKDKILFLAVKWRANTVSNKNTHLADFETCVFADISGTT